MDKEDLKPKNVVGATTDYGDESDHDLTLVEGDSGSPVGEPIPDETTV